MWLTFAILAVTILLFVADRLRLDVVAMLSLLALMLAGLVTTEEALAGFSNSLVIIIAGLFVVGAGIFHTGVASWLGVWLTRVAGASEARILVLVMLIVAFLSAFMSSTGAVAVLLPVVVSLARGAKSSPAKLLIPLAFGSLIGGMLTLIGTPPNLVVSNALRDAGLEPFSFFAFTPIGLAVLLMGIVYMVYVGRRLLPEGVDRRRMHAGMEQVDALTLSQLGALYHLPDNLYRLRIRRASPLVGRRLVDSQLGTHYHVTVLERQRWPHTHDQPAPPEPVTGETVLDEHDLLCVSGAPEDVARLCRELDLGVRPSNGEGNGRRQRELLLSRELGMAEVLVRARGALAGKTLKESRFRNKYNVNVLAIMRRGKALTGDLGDLPLRFGDTLLVEGPWQEIENLAQDRLDLIVVNQPAEMAQQLHSRENAAKAVAIVAAMLLIMTLQILPTVTAVLLAAVAMVLAGCVRVGDVYRSINWESVILIAAMLPMATALEKSGGVLFIADTLANNLAGYGPLVMMAGLYLITTFFSQFISNTATTVLLAPIAVEVSLLMGVPPQAFLMAVAIAASTAFATPISSPVNTLVLVPGGYRFSDYAKVGIPLQVLVLVVALLVIPLFFPLGAAP